MTPATDNMRSVADIVAALITQIESVKLEDDVTPAFQRVDRFDVESFLEAFELLLISEQRVCVIVVGAERYEPVLEGRRLLITRTLPVNLFISDRVLGNRVKALWGDPADASEPGAFTLAKRTLPAVTGQLLESGPDGAGVVCEPLSAENVFLKDEERKDLPGRSVVMLELQCSGGTIAATMQPGGNL